MRRNKLRKIAIFDPSYGTLNMGDFVISNAARKEIEEITNGSFILAVGTHNPVLKATQQIKSSKQKQFYKEADYKFLLGSNILKPNLFHLKNDWNISMIDSAPYKGVILVGAGFDGDSIKSNIYTRTVYKKILNKQYYHSVRDEKTKEFLEHMGLKAINTGCPTVWMLDEKHCSKIPHKKKDKVVFTLTDYRSDRINDQKLIDILQKNYKKVSFWVQGSQDYNYFKSLHNTKGIEIISPSLEQYVNYLLNNDCDYVGTRLHAGIQAMRCGRRAIIIIVDNRARDMKKTYNLVTIEREDINSLDKLINSAIETNVKINKKAIETWKAQFE